MTCFCEQIAGGDIELSPTCIGLLWIFQHLDPAALETLTNEALRKRSAFPSARWKTATQDRLIQAVIDSSGLPGEFVKLSKINARPCIACLGCKKGNVRKVKDDFPELAEKVRKANSLVLGGFSP